MNIAATQFNFEYGALEIYISGCNGNPKCTDCHNPELWDFKMGSPWYTWANTIFRKIEEFESLVKNIWILGGEPLDNNQSILTEFLYFINTRDIPIWLFTRYEIDQIPDTIKDVCSYIKCGRYLPELKSDDYYQCGVKLASTNQIIHKM
jgi:organic radical activating enzyme